MGLWDIAKATGNVALKAGKAAGDHVREQKEEMQSKSDDELIDIIRSRSGSSKLFAATELKSRGYDPEEIKMMAR